MNKEKSRLELKTAITAMSWALNEPERETAGVQENEPQENEAQENGEQLSQAQAKLLANLQVELDVELGKIRLSMEDLLDLSPGRLLEYVLEEAPSVGLRLGGALLAKGRIAKREGRLFVEICELC